MINVIILKNCVCQFLLLFTTYCLSSLQRSLDEWAHVFCEIIFKVINSLRLSSNAFVNLSKIFSNDPWAVFDKWMHLKDCHTHKVIKCYILAHSCFVWLLVSRPTIRLCRLFKNRHVIGWINHDIVVGPYLSARPDS